MAPAGTERLRMHSPQNGACAHPMGLKVAARTAFANAGSMRAAVGLHSTWNSSPAPYRQRSADLTKKQGGAVYSVLFFTIRIEVSG